MKITEILTENEINEWGMHDILSNLKSSSNDEEEYNDNKYIEETFAKMIKSAYDFWIIHKDSIQFDTKDFDRNNLALIMKEFFKDYTSSIPKLISKMSLLFPPNERNNISCICWLALQMGAENTGSSMFSRWIEKNKSQQLTWAYDHVGSFDNIKNLYNNT